MNWNAKPGSTSLPPPEYPRKRSPFLEQPFRSPLGSTPQSSLAYPGQSPEACAFLGSSDLAAQPQLGHPQAQLRNYGATSMQSGAMVMSQTSVERVTYASIKGPKALDHSVSPGAWLSPALRNPALQHPAPSAMPQSSFGMKAPAVAQVLQSPFVTSDTYSMQLQMVPVSSSRAPVSFQGSSRLSPASLQDFQGHWTQQQQQQQQQHTSSGPACPEYRPPPHTYPFSSSLSEPAVQKPGPVLARSSVPAAVLALPPQQAAPGQPDVRVASYSCSYAGQPLPSPQHVSKHTAAEPPRMQEPHTPDTRKKFCGSFRPVLPKPAENLSTLGSFCNVKVMNSIPSEPFHGPPGASMPGEPFHGSTRTSMPGEPFHGPPGTSMPGEPFHGPMRTSMSGEPFHNPPGTSMPGEPFHGHTRTSVSREPFHGSTRTSVSGEPFHGPVRTSVSGEPFHGPARTSVSGEPFHELARASVPMPGVQTVVPRRQEKRVAPCTLPPNSALDTNVTKEKLVRDIKTLVEIKNKFSELARKIKINKELLMAAGCIKTPNAPYSDPAPNPELVQKESSKGHSGSLLSLLTSGSTENKELDGVGGRPPSHRALGSDLHGPLSPEMLPVSAQGQGRPAQAPSQTSAVEGAPAAGSSTSCPAGSFAGIEQNEAADLGAPATFPPQSLREAEDKYLHKHPIILRLLEAGEHTVQGKLCRGAHETLQESQPTGPEARPGAPEAKAAEHALPPDLPSPASGAHSHSDSPCSMELLATCLSLWRNSPAEPARAVSREQPGPGPAAPGPCSKSGLAAGASGSRAAASPQDSAVPGAPQNLELPGMAVSKGSELQIAVVTPLVLSSAKPPAVKGGAPEMVYPVIKEGSVCSLQSRLAEGVGSPAALKACADGPKHWAAGRPEDAARQAEPGDGERAGENRLQIGSICSLVEGATSYNPQIAEMFSEPPGPVLAEHRNTGGRSQAAAQGVALSGRTAQWSTAPQPLEPASLGPPEPEPASQSPPGPEPASLRPPEPEPASQSPPELEPAPLHPPEPEPASLHPPELEPAPLHPPEPEPAPLHPPDLEPASLHPPELEPAPLHPPEPEPASLHPPELEPASLRHPPEPEPASLRHPPEPEPASLRRPPEPEPVLPRLPAPASPRPPVLPPLAPLHPGGGHCAAMEASGPGCRMERAGQTSDLGPGTAAQDGSCENAERAPGEEPQVLYLQDQLSELLREFPYGVTPMSTCEAPASWRLPSRGPERPRSLKPADAATATDDGQIKITVLNPEQMRALFPEQDLQEPDTDTEAPRGQLVSKEGRPPAGDKEGGRRGPQAQITEDGSRRGSPGQVSEGSQREPPAHVSKEGSWGDSPAQASEERGQQGPQAQMSEGGTWKDPLAQGSEEGSRDPPAQDAEEGRQRDTPAQGAKEGSRGDPPVDAGRAECPKNTLADPQKDDLPCCALGWLSAVYEGVPQCQCSLAKGHRKAKPPKRKRERPPPSQDASRHKQGEGPSAKDGPRHRSPLARLDRKRPFVGSGKVRDRAKAKPSGPGKPQQPLPGQRSPPAPRPAAPREPREPPEPRETPTPREPPESREPVEPAPSRGLPGKGKPLAGELARSPPEAPPRKQPEPGSQLPRAKGGFLPRRPKEQPPSAGPRKLLPKAGGAGHRAWEKRKSEGGGGLDAAPKRRRVDGPGQSPAEGPAGGGGSGKTPGGASLPREGDRGKAKPQARAPGADRSPPRAPRPASPGPVRGHKHKEAPAAKREPGRAAPRDRPGKGAAPRQEPGSKGPRPRPDPARDPSRDPTRDPAQDAAGPRKRYLNRVGFQCTARQSICLTQLDPPRRPRDGGPGMLEFKLCPEALVPQAGPEPGSGSRSERAAPQPGPRREQEPAQVSAIRSTKEDWLKGAAGAGRPDAARGAGGRPAPRLPRRSLSSDARPGGLQAMFQTYRRLYLEKRSRSLGSPGHAP